MNWKLNMRIKFEIDSDNNVINLDEITDYVYRSVPKYVDYIPGSIDQNPSFNGVDLKRTIVDLR